MQKIIAFILSIITLLSTLIPGLSGNQVQGVTTGEWLTMLDEQFGMSTMDISQEPQHYANIGPDNQYYAAVQIAYKWGVINDQDVIDVDANVTTEFVAATLVRVAMLQTNTPATVKNKSQLKYPSEVATAVSFGLVDLTSTGKFKVVTMAIDAAKAALAKAYELWQSKKFGAPAMVEKTEDVLNFSGDFEPALPVAEITAGSGAQLQAPYVPLDDPAGITQPQIDIASLLEKLDVSFSLGAFDFGLKVNGTNGFTLNVGADVCNGVKIAKTYEVSKLAVSTKFDGNLLTKDIKEAYIRADYDLKDITTVTGNYAASVAVDPSKLPANAGPVDFMTAAKAGALALMPGGGNKITVFSINVPIPNLPTITVSLDVNLRITVDGKIQITIESSQVKGVEIINNKVRIINEATYKQQTYDIMADVRFTVGLCFSVKALGYILVDAEFQAGIGIKVSAYIKTDTAVYTLDMPLDLAINIPYPTGGMDGAEFCGNAKIYGLMSVSVGQNSQLLKLIGLSKTWVIFDEGNATLYNLHIEENGIVDACTRART